ncbi:TPA: phosphonopyruvate decarboxylase [Campylobacter jejuni]|uniref:phosphonopyruvate decarboxylase n=1 Tax=Campylobacter jejuni TaxID=197 RepID=UPI00069C65CD|nr:phosphonopyruvate decarboxylase [Campylobacter jejuni]ECR2944612.1 phosphonopyruvate decarboxylase [Campylobacter jejuni]OWK87870.1 phosphonopyruvate decarboxylase [Campylobacter jejuni]HEF3760827.1 phosphonopyruvate decarboxylase [Campylobacter jejuni]HEG0441664.1 phosphonopyruvate decarboxylase [Campylobacter jejuni]HEG0462004.1 phosphonopyruvate decarboxylase [Campylobacter jejuni]
MIDSEKFASFLQDRFSFIAGVPDSLLKYINQALEEKLRENFHICANEGQAVAFGVAYNLATSKIPLIYMQNSGIGHALNPLLSLADKTVYQIPLILFIGLRGGVDDEPQHLKHGEISEKILKICSIKTLYLSQNITTAKRQINKAIEQSFNDKKIIAFLIKKNTFSKYSNNGIKNNNFAILREEAIALIQDIFQDSKFVTTTGMISRECYELRKNKNQTHENDFLVVGSMGHANSLAFILSRYSKKRIVCLDGDGALIMHMGGILNFKGASFLHIVFNNEMHDSVGGQRTHISNTNLKKMLKICGYDYSYSVATITQLKRILKNIKKQKGLIFLEIKVKRQTRDNLGRPKNLLHLKEIFCREF